jgi:hypothetical protein
MPAMSAARRLLCPLGLIALACSSGPLRLAPPDVNPAMVPPISAVTPVAVRAETVSKPPYALGIGTGSEVDDAAFTTALVAKVATALEALGVRVEAQAARAVALKVTRVSARLAGMHYECTVDFNRRLGADAVAGLQARSVDVDVHKACSFAVKEAATTSLADGAVRRYLEAP